MQVVSYGHSAWSLLMELTSAGLLECQVKEKEKKGVQKRGFEEEWSKARDADRNQRVNRV